MKDQLFMIADRNPMGQGTFGFGQQSFCVIPFSYMFPWS